MRKISAVLAAFMIIFVISGCDSTGQAATPPQEDAAPTQAPALTTCQFLEGALPRLREAGSDLGARAQLNVEYANFLGRQPAAKFADAALLDAATSRDCPLIRAEALKALNVKAFTKIP